MRMGKQFSDAVLESWCESGVVRLKKNADAVQFVERSNVVENVLPIFSILLDTSRVSDAGRVDQL